MELKFRYRFEAAHRFTDASSKCSTPHGHSWWVTLSLSHNVAAIDLERNFAIDFTDLKKEWRKFIDEELDHHFFVNSKDPLLKALNLLGQSLRIKETPGDPTTELLASIFFKKAENIFKKNNIINVQSVLLEETPTNSVKVSKEDSAHFLGKVATQETNWWS